MSQLSAEKLFTENELNTLRSEIKVVQEELRKTKDQLEESNKNLAHVNIICFSFKYY